MDFPVYFAYWPGQNVLRRPFAACGCCLDANGRLTVPEFTEQPELMVFHDSNRPLPEQISTLANTLAIAATGCHGILLDMEETPPEYATALAAGLRAQLDDETCIILPERCATESETTLYTYNPIYETYRQFLTRVQRANGNAWMELAPIHLLTPLPVPMPTLVQHDPIELEELCCTRQLPRFYSDTLCCCYFSFLKDQTVYLGLYDTPQTLQNRLEQARQFCTAAVGLGFELQGMLPEKLKMNQDTAHHGA